MQHTPRPPVTPTPFNAPAFRPPRPPAPATTTMSAASGMMMRPPGGFDDHAALRATPAVAAAAAAAERDGIETVSVTNVVSAPAINKIGSLFNSLNKTVTGALNSIITGAPVAPGGAQTQPMSTALSPLPAWRVPQRPTDAFADHVQLQRFQPPPVQHPPQQPVVRTIFYESQQHQQQQPYSVPSSVYWPAVQAQPSYQPASYVDQAPARGPADWYSHFTPATAAIGAPAYGGDQAMVDQRPPAAAVPATTSPPSAITSPPHPSAFSRVDIAPRRGEWQSLPDMDRRPGGQGPPSPVYSNASSTCFIPPTDWSTNRFGSTQPILPSNHFSGLYLSAYSTLSTNFEFLPKLIL